MLLDAPRCEALFNQSIQNKRNGSEYQGFLS